MKQKSFLRPTLKIHGSDFMIFFFICGTTGRYCGAGCAIIRWSQCKGQGWWSPAVLSSAPDAEITFRVKREKGVFLRWVGSLQCLVAILGWPRAEVSGGWSWWIESASWISFVYHTPLNKPRTWTHRLDEERNLQKGFFPFPTLLHKCGWQEVKNHQ